MSAPFDAECMEDALTEAIGGSIDMDWTPRCGAQAAMEQLGLWDLYRIANILDRSGYGMTREHRIALSEVCAKVRGEQVVK